MNHEYDYLLFTADLHLRDTQPKCRTDDFETAQWKKFHFILQTCLQYNAFWVDAGDFFHKAQPSLSLLEKTLYTLRHTRDVTGGYVLATVAGNHDLPAHNMGRIRESGLGILAAAGVVKVLNDGPFVVRMKLQPNVILYGCSYGEEIPKPMHNDSNHVLVYHGMVYGRKEDVIPQNLAPTGFEMLAQNPDYRIILTGHNHTYFYCLDGSRRLYNPGSMTRQTADQEKATPHVFLWNARTDGGERSQNERIILPYEEGVISREHIETQQQKDEELNAFVEHLQNVEDVSLSFEDNVDKVMAEVKPNKLTKQRVKEAIYEP